MKILMANLFYSKAVLLLTKQVLKNIIYWLLLLFINDNIFGDAGLQTQATFKYEPSLFSYDSIDLHGLCLLTSRAKFEMDSN